MAAPWAAGARARIIGRISGQLTVTVLHFATNTVINDPQTLEQLLKDLANAIRDCIGDVLLPAVSQDWTFEQVECSRIAPDLSDPFVNDNLNALAGTAGVQGVPFASQLVAVRTGVGGRTGRGRMFLPPAGEDHATAGSWDPTALALLAQFCACMAGKFIGNAATEDWRLGVLSRKLFANSPANFDTAFREATSLTPVPIIAVMGTRKVGRGA